MADVLVVGCGLIGTSIGLALPGSGSGDVVLDDRDAARVEQAVARGAGRQWDGREKATLVVAAVPPRQVARTLAQLQQLDIGQTYTHVSSVQARVQAEVESSSRAPALVVGGHPMAGRELSGPGAALADLFAGRPWAVCPGPSSTDDAVSAVVTLARECGATPLVLSASEHDRAVALSSHVPQVVSSALAELLAGDSVQEPDLRLAGPGLADMTRLAASDPGLWIDILTANAAQVAGPVGLLGRRLVDLAAALGDLADGDERAEGEIAVLLRQGNAGRDRVPFKRGESAGAFQGVRVSVADEPGQLAALLASAGRAGLNVEDVRVEHVPGRPRGVIELLVAPAALDAMRLALSSDGWHVL